MAKFLLLIAIALGFLSVLFDGFVTYYSDKKASKIFSDKMEINEDIQFHEDLITALINAETGERGYVITGEERYLEPYQYALHLLQDPKMATLLSKEGGNTISAHLKTLIDDRLSILEEEIKLHRSQGFEAAQKSLQVGRGKELMDEIRILVKAAIDKKRGQLLKKEKDLNKELEKINLIATLGNAAVFLLMASCLVAIYLYASKAEKKQKDLLSLKKIRDAIMGRSRETILTLDSNGVVTTCNKAIERLVDVPTSQIIGSSFARFIHPEDESLNLKNLSNKYHREFKGFSDVLAFVKEGQAVEDDAVWTLGNNEQLYFQTLIAPLIDADGVFTGYLIEGNDITERVRQDEKLLQARLQAENANRAKSHFLANMSHDLRTPLTAVIGYTDMFRENESDNLNPKQLGYLKRIEENSLHLLNMVIDILDLEKIESHEETIELSEVRIAPIINLIFKELEGEARKKRITLEADGLQDLQPIHTDEKKLYHILRHLVKNGVKFTREGSVKVLITQGAYTHQPERIDVMDTGIGVDPALQDRIFDPFFQALRIPNKLGEGVGLGLSICKSLCQLLGYRISFQSQLEKGSIFTIHLA